MKKLGTWVLSICKFAGSRNAATFDGKPFWCGAVDLETGEILEIHTFEKASENDFHHSLYFSPSAQEGMRIGTIGFFYLGEDSHVELDHLERPENNPNPVNPNLASIILSQIKMRPKEAPSPWALPKKTYQIEGD